MKSMKIQTKITILYGSFFSLSLIIVSAMFLRNAALSGEKMVKQELFNTMTNIESYIKEGHSISEETISSLLDNKYVEVKIIKKGTKEVIESTVGPIPSFADRDTLVQNEEAIDKEAQFKIRIGKATKEYLTFRDKGQEFMIMELDVDSGKNNYIVQAYKMLSDDIYYMKWLAVRVFVVDIIGIMIAFLIGRYISNVLLRPIEKIRVTAEQISSKDLSGRITIDGPDDEIKELSVTFNLMIERLEEAFIQQNRFVADASHELRTPISVIQGYANLVNRWGKSDPAVLQEAIESILAETDHMGVLIKKLLFLAKSDQNRACILSEPVSLNDAVREIYKEISIMDVKREIEIIEEDNLIITGDHDLIKQLLWIHAENAIKYSDENGKLIFRLYKDGENKAIDISDNGKGIAKEDLPHIFDRFYRVDKSRNKDIPGTGLGLSIAKWIATKHNGTITVKSGVGEGSVFTVKFNQIK